jgi:putative DNA primase/helicase
LTAAPYDPNAECPLWLEFLGQVLPDPELVAYVQKLIGYSLTGEVIEHSLHILFGTGRNGKGVFTNTCVKGLGDYGDVTDPETFLARKDAAHPSNTAVLHGKRLVASSETDSGRRLNEATVKNLTGGDIVKTRRMHQDWWSYIPTATMLLATNHLPAVRGTDVGIWSRLHVVPFTVSFLGREDLRLEEKLRAERAGILNWMVQGCLAWQRYGLVVPDAVKIATNAYRADMDSVGRWLAEECELTGNPEHRWETLYVGLNYQAWCEREGETPLEATPFGRALSARGVKSDKSNGVRYRTGIREKT